MDKEREHELESGFSEKQLDKAVDQTHNFNQVKAGSIFDPKKNPSSRKTSEEQGKNKEQVILDSTSQ